MMPLHPQQRPPVGSPLARPPGALPAAPPRQPPPARPRGVALLVALSVVVLLTAFITEFFFATGMEIRGMTTFKETLQARALTRSVLKVVQTGLLLDEVEFFNGFREAEKLLSVAVLPWGAGLLVELKVEPQDHLYSFNEFHNLRPGEDKDRVRWNLFYNIMSRIELPAENPDDPPIPLSDDFIASVYAALYDWVDNDDDEYNQFPSVRGAESSHYSSADPEYTPKNGMLDRLDEIRLVRGVSDGGVTWDQWAKRFSTLPRSGEGGFFYPESINVNVASREEIQEFLENRYMDPALIEGAGNGPIQVGINAYVERAEEIADKFAAVDDDGAREAYNPTTLASTLKGMGFTDKYGTNYLFSVINQYYKVTIVTEVNTSQARLEAVLHVPRSPTSRTGTGSDVVWITTK